MRDILFEKCGVDIGENIASLRKILSSIEAPFAQGAAVGVKVHWGERGNTSFLPPEYTREIVSWLKQLGAVPFVFDTTVLYSGGRRDGNDALNTAAEHGFTEQFLGCPIVIADGKDGSDVMDIPAGYKHFNTVQVASLIANTDGFVVFSHFKGHMVSGFGGAIKNLSMGFASRAQKQRMHANVYPVLKVEKCTSCGVCVQHCPTGAATFNNERYPKFDLEKCIGCAQCIALCPQVALKIFWDIDRKVFQERLVETAAAVWKIIAEKTVFINALLKITKECDCMPGKNPVIADDVGYIAGYSPVEVDAESIRLIGENVFNEAHLNIPWKRQFQYAEQIGFK